MEINRNIWVTHSFIGYHQWSEAPKEVDFLKDNHRHRFHVRLSIQVNTDDRDIEFFMLQRQLKKFCDKVFEEKHNLGSCEMIGKKILNHFMDFYPDRSIMVDVSEDGENGSQVKNF